MSRFIWGAEMENHPMGGYYCDGKIENASFEEWRFGAIASQAIQRSGMNKKGELDIDLVSGVENFTDTVLFVAGSCNKFIGADFQKRQMSYFPYARLEIIEEAGHTMFGEKPEESLAIIRKYFATFE
jgi:proline iminopeptidase